MIYSAILEILNLEIFTVAEMNTKGFPTAIETTETTVVIHDNYFKFFTNMLPEFMGINRGYSFHVAAKHSLQISSVLLYSQNVTSDGFS